MFRPLHTAGPARLKPGTVQSELQKKLVVVLVKGTDHPKMSFHFSDYFNDVLTMFLCLDLYPCCLWRVRELSDFIRNIFICVLKMNGGLTGLERHEGE